MAGWIVTDVRCEKWWNILPKIAIFYLLRLDFFHCLLNPLSSNSTRPLTQKSRCYIPWAGKLIGQTCQKWHIDMILLDIRTHFSLKQTWVFPHQGVNQHLPICEKLRCFVFLDFVSDNGDLRGKWWKLQSILIFLGVQVNVLQIYLLGFFLQNLYWQLF